MDFRVSELTVADIDALTALIVSDRDYTMRVFGRPPRDEDAHSILRSIPPGLAPESKTTLGLWEGDRLIGVADVVCGYPRPEVVYLGLLQIAPDHQGRGAGRTLRRAVVDRAVRDQGLTILRLSIVATNADVAEGFWRCLGYAPTREAAKEWVREDGVVTTAHPWELALSSGGSPAPGATAR